MDKKRTNISEGVGIWCTARLYAVDFFYFIFIYMEWMLSWSLSLLKQKKLQCFEFADDIATVSLSLTPSQHNVMQLAWMNAEIYKYFAWQHNVMQLAWMKSEI